MAQSSSRSPQAVATMDRAALGAAMDKVPLSSVAATFAMSMSHGMAVGRNKVLLEHWHKLTPSGASLCEWTSFASTVSSRGVADTSTSSPLNPGKAILTSTTRPVLTISVSGNQVRGA